MALRRGAFHAFSDSSQDGMMVNESKSVRMTHSARGTSRDRQEILEHVPQKWEPVFGKRSCSNKKEVERDDDSKKNHPALFLLSQKDIKRKPLENQIKVEIRAAA